MIPQNVTNPTCPVQVNSIVISHFYFVQLMIRCKYIAKKVGRSLFTYLYQPFRHCNSNITLTSNKCNCLKRGSVWALCRPFCHNPKCMLWRFVMQSDSKPPVCNSEWKVRKNQRIIHQFHCRQGQVSFKSARYAKCALYFVSNFRAYHRNKQLL